MDKRMHFTFCYRDGALWAVRLVRFHVVLGSVEIRGIALLAQGVRVSVHACQLHVELAVVVIPVLVIRIARVKRVGGGRLAVGGSGLRHFADGLPVDLVQGDDVEHWSDSRYRISSYWSAFFLGFRTVFITPNTWNVRIEQPDGLNTRIGCCPSPNLPESRERHRRDPRQLLHLGMPEGFE